MMVRTAVAIALPLLLLLQAAVATRVSVGLARKEQKICPALTHGDHDDEKANAGSAGNMIRCEIERSRPYAGGRMGWATYKLECPDQDAVKAKWEKKDLLKLKTGEKNQKSVCGELTLKDNNVRDIVAGDFYARDNSDVLEVSSKIEKKMIGPAEVNVETFFDKEGKAVFKMKEPRWHSGYEALMMKFDIKDAKASVKNAIFIKGGQEEEQKALEFVRLKGDDNAFAIEYNDMYFRDGCQAFALAFTRFL